MVTADQLKRGAARYLDEEITLKLTGWQKWAVGASSAMALENLGAALPQLRENPMIKLMGVIDEAGNVDIDRLYKHFRAEAQKGATTLSVPMLGTVTLNERDVEKLYTCIIQA